MVNNQNRIRTVVIYARLSVSSSEESVSISRQLEAGRKYADARGWVVAGEFVDDGVSASKVRPEHRPGWRGLLDSPMKYDAVVIWKVDRLARRVLDFLHADEQLQARGAAVVAVEDPIDMTTPQGRAFATLLAVFGEMEAAAISARVTAAREAIIKSGRRAGGRVPFGWMNVPNPNGPGLVLAADPERIGVVSELAARALRGDSLYSLSGWLTEQDVWPRTGQRKQWHDASVEATLRSPSLAGMVAFRGDVLRGEDGLPIVDESVAILTPAERRTLLARLDAAKRPGTRQRAGHEPALLYGIVRCGSCGGLMYRATAAGKYAQYRCQAKACSRRVGISRPALEEYVADLVAAERGHLPLVESEDVTPTEDVPRLVEIEAAIRETSAKLAETDDEDEEEELTARLRVLKEERRRAREGGGAERRTFKVTGTSFMAAWVAAGKDVEVRRRLLLTQLDAIHIGVGGGRGRAFDASRVTPNWRPAPLGWEHEAPSAAELVWAKVQASVSPTGERITPMTEAGEALTPRTTGGGCH